MFDRKNGCELTGVSLSLALACMHASSFGSTVMLLYPIIICEIVVRHVSMCVSLQARVVLLAEAKQQHSRQWWETKESSNVRTYQYRPPFQPVRPSISYQLRSIDAMDRHRSPRHGLFLCRQTTLVDQRTTACKIVRHKIPSRNISGPSARPTKVRTYVLLI